jgi:hypothetical protein
MKKLLHYLLIFCFAIMAKNTQSQIPNGYTRKIKPTMDEIMGLNIRQESVANTTKLSKFNNLRYFHIFSDDVGYAPNKNALCFNEITTANTYQLNHTLNDNIKYYDYDNFYGGLKQKVTPVLHMIDPSMRGYTNFQAELYQQKPICLTGPYTWNGSPIKAVNGTNVINTPADNLMPSPSIQATPSTYISQSKRMSLFATKYGNSGLASPCWNYYRNRYKTDEKNKDARGLNSVKYYETYNETDKTWLDNDPAKLGTDLSWFQMSASQLGAMLSACYDGHGRSSSFLVDQTNCNEGLYLGLKNADASSKLVIPGVAELRGKYIKDIVQWCVANRVNGGFDAKGNIIPGVHGYSNKTTTLPFDVINFHHYVTVRGIDNIHVRDGLNSLTYTDYFGGGGATPEQDDLVGDLDYCLNTSMSASNGALLNNKEVWLSEFGWDSKKSDNDNASEVDINYATATERRLKQAQWVMRAFLQVANTNQVDKAMMYEAADDVGTGQFTSCGLFTENYANRKESYYFYQTLKNVLKGYAHQFENTGLNPSNRSALNNYKRIHSDIKSNSIGITNISGNPLLLADSIYCYKFNNVDYGKTIYALWSGTGINRNGKVSLPIYSASAINAISYIVPTILDEDGVKINHPKSKISNSYTPSITINNVKFPEYYLTTITDLPVSETPIFIILNDSTPDKSTPPNITNLTGTGSCCGGVKLCWQTPAVVSSAYFTDYYHVYYTTNTTSTTLSLSDLTLSNDYLTSGTNCTYVPGLQPGLSYRFFVVPYNRFNTPVSTNINDWASVVFKPDNCVGSSCFTTPPSITGNNTYKSIFSVPNGCSDLYSFTACDPTPLDKNDNNCALGGWDDFSANANFVIDYGGHVTIPSFHYYNHCGQGRLKFEYQNCTCPNIWQPLTTVYVKGNGDNCGFWSVVNNFANIALNKLRITKLDGEVRPIKLFFCTQAASCIPTPRRMFEKQASDLSYNYITENTAGITFKAGFAIDSTNNNIQVAENYQLKISSQWSGNELINPMIIPITIEHNKGMADFAISDLNPSTTYKLLLTKDPIPCLEGISPLLGPLSPLVETFTTKGSYDASVLQRKTKETGNIPMVLPELLIYPNPTSGELNITMPNVGYNSLEVYDMSGKLMEKFAQNMNTRYGSINIEKLASGFYIIKAIGVNVPIVSSKIVKE